MNVNQIHATSKRKYITQLLVIYSVKVYHKKILKNFKDFNSRTLLKRFVALEYF